MVYLIVIVTALLAVAGMVEMTAGRSDSAHLAEVLSLQRRIDALTRDLSGLGEKVTADQVEEALRGAGYEPSKGEEGVISFKLNGENVIVRTDGIPFIPMDIVFRLDPRQNDYEVLEKIAAEITASLAIGKVFLDEEQGFLLFRAGILAETRGCLAGQIRDVVTALADMRKRFDGEFDAYTRMRREQCILEEMQAMRDGASIVQGRRNIRS
jgi:hypothetical protein